MRFPKDGEVNAKGMDKVLRLLSRGRYHAAAIAQDGQIYGHDLPGRSAAHGAMTLSLEPLSRHSTIFQMMITRAAVRFSSC